MKLLIIVLTALLLVLQYDLWIGEGSLSALWQIQRDISVQRMENKKLQTRNDTLAAEVDDLKRGNDAIEERARSELGMIKQNETFVQVVETPPKAANPK
ncbi:MAG: cell division protein FtsB [Gammaproteobacteria bacterium]|nr:cell division protein FtsB [Gammaproteobacteria bacterium]